MPEGPSQSEPKGDDADSTDRSNGMQDLGSKGIGSVHIIVS